MPRELSAEVPVPRLARSQWFSRPELAFDSSNKHNNNQSERVLFGPVKSTRDRQSSIAGGTLD